MLIAGEIGRLNDSDLLSTDYLVILRDGELFKCTISAIDQITISGNTFSDGENGININDAGTESDGVDINGTIYNVGLRINDIGTDYPGELVIHRHSTALPAVVLGTRSNSENATHASVTNSMVLWRLIGCGWAGSNYKMFGDIRFRADSTGTINNTSSPGLLELRVTPDGDTNPTVALSLDNAGTTIIEKSVVLTEQASAPPALTSGNQCRTYMRGDKYIIQYNQSGTVKYRYLDLTSTDATWVYTTVAP
jgi:hypothetical protein